MKDLLDLEKGSVLRVYKPYTWTSFDVTKKIQRLILRKLSKMPKPKDGIKRKVKVGHAGTLDPLATGLLIICIGKETKNIEQYMGLPKTYTGSFFLGAFRPSFDKETEVTESFSIDTITAEMIYDAANKLSGELDQVPPLFSAIQKDGKRAYEFARAGVEMELPSRKVMVHEFEITSIELPLVYFKITCSKGTYIRSLARDFGKLLNNGAYLESLCRTNIGNFSLNEAFTLDELAESFGEELINRAKN
ncbi:MAG: tRNA pseudouridine(55) synthase TruB [Bacteroidia bacterium]|nr:tRNA pseudouridine(55) synthase TruB [Bacteroidia bacterium]